MDERKLIDRIYQVEEECHDFLSESKGKTQDCLFRIEDEIDQLERDLQTLYRARDLYMRLDEMELDDREKISDFIFAFGKKVLAQNPKDKKKALFYFDFASDYGGIKAKIEYAKSLIYGTCGVSSPEEGVDILRGLSDDVPEAAYLLYLLHGEYPALIEAEEAKENYEKAARLGYAPAFSPLPADFDLRTYTEKLLAAYEEGDLSVCYELSKRKDLSKKEAKRFLNLAARNHDPKAEEELGFQYMEEGKKEEALKYYVRAARDGSPRCYVIAAHLLEVQPHFYEGGEGEPQKMERHLYELAAKKNVPQALARFGEFHRFEKEYEKAIRFFKKAIRQGDCFSAPVPLAEMYRNGEGVEKDVPKAVSYYKKAADNGNVVALLALAEIYEKGEGGIKKDEALASRYRFMSGVGRD
ncbi:MAG: sel1 repeat family protein [Bacilli bacterium]|nr:sel1 repeat family protein [Bacilli bacterium]